MAVRRKRPVTRTPPSGAGRNWVPVAAVIGIAFLVKVLVLVQLIDHPLLQPDAGVDTTAYADLARRVVAGDWGLGPGLYYVSPLYIYFLAAILAVTGSFTAVHVVQIVLGSLTVGAIFMMARAWAGDRAGWLAAIMATGCGVFTFHEITLMQSAIDPFLTACALLALLLALRPETEAAAGSSSRLRWFFLFGACLGLQTLNRPQVLLPVVAMVLLLGAMRRIKPAAVVAAGLVAALLPVAARNVAVSGQWSLVSSHGGLNFYIGNSESATGLYQIVPGIRPDIDGQREDTRRVAEAALGRPLTDTEVSGYYEGLAGQWIRSHPFDALRLFGKKLMLSVHADHVPLPHSYDFFAGDARTALRGLILNPWLVMPIGLAGLLLAGPRERPDDRLNFRLWAAFVPLYAIALAVFFLAERYRLPLLVPVYAGAGMFADQLLQWHAAGRGRDVLRAVLAAGLLAVAVNWPFSLADGREGDRLRMVRDAATHGRTEEAERWAALLVSSAGSPAEMETRIGRTYLSVDRPREALAHLRAAMAGGQRSPEVLVDIADAELQLGDAAAAGDTLRSMPQGGVPASLLLRAGRLASGVKDPDLAVTLFRRATQAEPALADGWAQLAFALLVTDRLDEAEPAFQEAIRLNPADAVALGGAAVCAARRGDTAEALRRATAALKLDPAEPLANQVMAALRGR